MIVALITSIPPTLFAFAAWRQSGKVHNLINSRMTELLEITKREAAANATLLEKTAERMRQGAAAKAIQDSNGDVHS